MAEQTLRETETPEIETLDPSETRVFLSYSRKDRDQAQRIADVLRERSFGVFRDTDDILPTEEWRDRLQQLIEESDTIVFLMSPHSIASEVCAWEVNLATSLNKRIAPIVIEDVDTALIPPALAKLNFIFCTERDPFENAVGTLISALNTDVDWIREHTRLATLARRWRKTGSVKRLLLRGEDISDAERWRDTRPEEAPAITPEQATFIAESRRAASARQRQWIGGSAIIAAASIALAAFAYLQSVEADTQRAVAESQRQEAEAQRADAVAQRTVAEREKTAALTTQSLFLADLSRQKREDARAAEAIALALEALPLADDLTARPILPSALYALRQGVLTLKERAVVDLGDPALSISVHPQQPWLYVGRGKDIEIWDLEHSPPKILKRLPTSEDIHKIALSGDGTKIAIQTVSRTIRVRDANTGARIWDRAPEDELAKIFLLNHHGSLVRTFYNRITTTAFDQKKRPFKGSFKLADITSQAVVAMSPDGKMILAGDSKSEIRYGTIGSDNGLKTYNLSAGPIDAVALTATADGAPLAAVHASDGTIFVFDPTTGDTITSINAPYDITSLRFSDDASQVISGDKTGGVAIWNGSNGTLVSRMSGHDAPVIFASLTNAGRTLISRDTTGLIRVWHPHSDGSAHIFPNESATSTHFAFDATGALISYRQTGEAPPQTQVGQDPKQTADLIRTKWVVMRAIDQAKNRFAMVENAKFADDLDKSRLTIWNMADGSLDREIQIDAEQVGPVTFSPDGRVILIEGDNGRASVGLPNAATPVPLQTTEGQVGTFMFSPDSRTILFVYENGHGTIAYHLADDGVKATTFFLGPATNGLAAISPDGVHAVLATTEGPVLWNINANEWVPLSDHGPVRMMDALTFAGTNLLLSSEGTTVSLWKVAPFERLRDIPLNAPVVDFISRGDTALASHADGSAAIFRVSDGAMLLTIPPRPTVSPTTLFDLSPDGSAVLVGDGKISEIAGFIENEWRMWKIDQDAAHLIETSTRAIGPLSPLSLRDRCAAFLLGNDACVTVPNRQ